MGSTLSRMGHDAPSRIDYEILRLKRELVSDDFKGHSCEQCNGFRVKPPRNYGSDWKLWRESKFFEIHTTGRKVRDLAETGCCFWVMIRDQLTYIDLEAMVKREVDKVAFDPEKYSVWWSDDHYKDLAASLGGNEGEEFWRLRHQRGVSWGFSAGATVGVHVTEADFVHISIRYSYPNNKPITVQVELIVPDKSLWGDLGVNGEPRLVEYWTRFLPLKLPGTYSSPG